VPASKLIIFRRQQTFGSASGSWVQFQDAAQVQSCAAGAPFTVPTGQHFVVTGLRYWMTGTNGVELILGVAGANVNPMFMTRAPVVPTGTIATLERFEHFTNGIAFPGGSKVDVKVTKLLPSSTDTVVWLFLYGYFETP
jgi:hypothetical protein